ncbi:pectate lyase family protein [Thermomonospora cellulosilytica]|uniref:Pectate lyase n=1 Tax=Thermomonospora cellulosilytica TaxID=1411118 RepID=A0A7W3R9Q4_9ACTN|nr:right-handed parallel beta-helix repeat-containing protein [Thermomonospora cellulosilytica]MBA9005623.1 pectate lyase [Thermomonospora cellulosilytica]
MTIARSAALIGGGAALALAVSGCASAVQVRQVAQQAAAAFESSPVGYASLNGGTTGGAGGTTVTVTGATDFVRYATASGRYVIRVNGTVRLSGMQKVASDKTIIGVGTAGRITGGGLNLSGVRNVVIRNLAFSGSSDDAINVERSTNVWIDHNDLTDAYDGLIDIKRGSDYITVSWNHAFGHDKTFLLGHSDDNGAEDRGHLRVTYVHNWFDRTNQRHPRVRFGNPVHVLNNYFYGIGSYGVASTENAGVYVERNYFENTSKPTVTQTGDSASGNIKLLNNHLVNSGAPASRNSTLVAPIPYSYTPDGAPDVKSIVTAGAGVGKI